MKRKDSIRLIFFRASLIFLSNAAEITPNEMPTTNLVPFMTPLILNEIAAPLKSRLSPIITKNIPNIAFEPQSKLVVSPPRSSISGKNVFRKASIINGTMM